MHPDSYLFVFYIASNEHSKHYSLCRFVLKEETGAVFGHVFPSPLRIALIMEVGDG